MIGAVFYQSSKHRNFEDWFIDNRNNGFCLRFLKLPYRHLRSSGDNEVSEHLPATTAK